MQSVWRMVLVRIFLSASLATSSGARGFSMRLSEGVLWTGTRRCISTLAAAEEAMGLTGRWASRRGKAELESGPGRESRPGMTMTSRQEGQLISVPAPELSTANSWSHLGQLKMTSITGAFRFDCGGMIKGLREAGKKKNGRQSYGAHLRITVILAGCRTSRSPHPGPLLM